MNTEEPIVLAPFVVAEDSLVPTWKGAAVLAAVVFLFWVLRKK